MSSIAYVTDEKMIEYHRLCGNRTINFWRLSSKKDFTDFHPGDLLFFFSRLSKGKKGFVGYAHFDSTNRLSLNQMWKRFGKLNGYNTIEQLSEAISRAAKDKPIPKEMNCLYLKDAVYFNTPVDPASIGISISGNLESYCYLDQEDPQVTVRILKEAEKGGIDVWSSSLNQEPQNVFLKDGIRHQLAVICRSLGNGGMSEREKARARHTAKHQVHQPGWEMIQGSQTDCILLQNDSLILASAYASQIKDRDERFQEAMGRLLLYRMKIRMNQIPIKKLSCQLLSTDMNEEEEALLNEFNQERL